MLAWGGSGGGGINIGELCGRGRDAGDGDEVGNDELGSEASTSLELPCFMTALRGERSGERSMPEVCEKTSGVCSEGVGVGLGAGSEKEWWATAEDTVVAEVGRDELCSA